MSLASVLQFHMPSSSIVLPLSPRVPASMGSLFAGLFQHAGQPGLKGAAVNPLFSESSRYKAHLDASHAAAQLQQAVAVPAGDRKRKSGQPQERKERKDRAGPVLGSTKAAKKRGGTEPGAADSDVQPATAIEEPKNKRHKQAAVEAAQVQRVVASAAAAQRLGAPAPQAQQQAVRSRVAERRSGKAEHKKKREEGQARQGPPPSALAAVGQGGNGGEGAGTSDGEGPAMAGGQQQQGAGLSAAEREAAEQEKLQRTVFVGNLAATVRRKALKKLFARYGKVESVRVRSLPLKSDAKMPRKAAAVSGNIDIGRASAHAYVVFEEEAAAEAAVAHNMREFEGLHLRVDRAAAGSKGGREESGVHYDPARSLFVGNLPLDIEDEELIRFFMDPSTPGGGVEAVRVVRDAHTSTGKGIAFVLFSTTQACKAGLVLDGKPLKGRAVRVTRVRRDPKHSGNTGGKAAEPWQGTVTKGRNKGGGPVLAGAVKKGVAGSSRGGGGAPLGVRKSAGKGAGKAHKGKRPAVAARKQRQAARGGGKSKKGK